MRSTILALGLVLAGLPAAAQDLATGSALILGAQARGYSIDGGPKTHQFAFPLAAVWRVNDRFAVDIGSFYARTSSEPAGGSEITIDGFTDTQVRGSYTFGQDAVVASLMVNIPTGHDPKLSEAGATGAAAANFLSFPVNNYSTGLSATGGLAFATTAGAWNLGIAGSLRFNGEYEPFSDDATKYTPGTEGRVRLAAERLFASSRLVLGFTWSTFGNDEFKNLGGGSGGFAPGDRFIGEASLTFVAGTGSITGFVWDYHRTAASTAGGGGQKENILSIGASGSWPVGTNMRLEPVLEGRLWSPEDGNGRLVSGGLGLQVPLGTRFTLAPSARFDIGSTEFEDGTSHSITGWGGIVLVRYQL